MTTNNRALVKMAPEVLLNRGEYQRTRSILMPMFAAAARIGRSHPGRAECIRAALLRCVRLPSFAPARTPSAVTTPLSVEPSLHPRTLEIEEREDGE